MADFQEQELEQRLEEARGRVEDADQRLLSVDELNQLRAAAHQAWSDLEEYRRTKRESTEAIPHRR